jgi:hypothetical protein
MAQGDPGPSDPGEAAAGERRIERTIVPLVGGDTDIGVGIGAIGSLARVDPDIAPFRWKLEGAALATFKVRSGPELVMPFQDVFLHFTRNGLFAGRLRVEARIAFTRETNLRYYGLGNDSPAPPGNDDVPARDFFIRTHPAARARARLRLEGPLHIFAGATYVENWLEYDPTSTLASDLANGNERVRSLLMVDRRHGLALFEAGVILDTRDDEVSPSRGQYHQLDTRVSPFLADHIAYRYVGFSGTLRCYLPLWGERLVAAVRAVGDVIIGDPPFYELSRFDETSALGGAKYIRGIPSNRYYGKRKVLGNFELRAQVWRFGLGKSQYELGITGFFDTGRVWADLSSAPSLDGRGIGLKYGTGAGLRLQKGRTFVLRGDLAWSPDARPIGGYFLAGHIF